MDCLSGDSRMEEDAAIARAKARARSYTMMDVVLYKKGVVQPWLKCITQEEGKELLEEIHLGLCGSHIGSRALSTKAIR